MIKPPPASPSKLIHEPISLKKLLNQLSNGQIICVKSPFPYVNNCNRSVDFDDREQKLSKACDFIRDFLNEPHAHRGNTFDELAKLAKTFSCHTHNKNGKEFAYHWLAEASLPNILKHMGWKKDAYSWTCLGSNEDRICRTLDCIQQKRSYPCIYSSLNKLAIGEHGIVEPLKGLMKYWLCDDHETMTEILTRQLSEKLLKYTSGKDIAFKTGHIGKRETLDCPGETEQITQGKADNKPIEIADSSNNSNNPVTPIRSNARHGQLSQYLTAATVDATPPNTRAPIIEKSASERTARTKAINPSSLNNRRAASASAASSALGLNPNDPRKRRRISSSSVYEPSPLHREAEHTHSTNNDDSPSADPDGGSPPSLVTPGQWCSSELLDGMANDELSENESATSKVDAGAAVSGISEKGQGAQPPTPRSSNTAGQPKGTPGSPNWTRKGVEKARHEIVTKLCRQMKRNVATAARGTNDGWIYIFSSPNFPGHLKIGRTTNEIRVRKQQIKSQCKDYELDMVVEEECFKKTSWHVRLEKLIHEDLSDERRQFPCSCKKPNSEHNSDGGNTKQTKHGEWFAIDETRAKDVVKKWKDWMRQEPYSKDGRLNEAMLQKVDKWERYPETFDDPWYEWKRCPTIVVVCWLLLSALCFFLVKRSWELSLILGAAFPLFSIWYAA